MSVELARDAPVATLTLDNPERHNALTPEDRYEAARLVAEIQYDNEIRALVVRGAGRSFCAGADVGRMGQDGLFASRVRMQRGAHALVRTLSALEKPVIASVRGYTLGMGWSIALTADIILASSNTQFCTMFARRGLAPDAGAIHLLARNVGELRAKELVYRARMIDAAEALRLGLVTDVIEDDRLDAATGELACELAAGPTRALGFAKKLFEVAGDSGFEKFLEVESLVQPQLNQSADYHEGVAAFREKRPPHFVGN